MNLAKVLFWQPQAIVPSQQASNMRDGKVPKWHACPLASLLVVLIKITFRGESHVTKYAGTAEADKSWNVVFEELAMSIFIMAISVMVN